MKVIFLIENKFCYLLTNLNLPLLSLTTKKSDQSKRESMIKLYTPQIIAKNIQIQNIALFYLIDAIESAPTRIFNTALMARNI